MRRLEVLEETHRINPAGSAADVLAMCGAVDRNLRSLVDDVRKLGHVHSVSIDRGYRTEIRLERMSMNWFVHGSVVIDIEQEEVPVAS